MHLYCELCSRLAISWVHSTEQLAECFPNEYQYHDRFGVFVLEWGDLNIEKLRQKCLKVVQVKSIYVWNKVTVCVLVPTTAISTSHPPPLINPMFINWHVRGAIHHGWWNIEMATDGEGFLEMPFFSWNQGVPNVRFEVRFVLQCRPLIVTNTDSLKKNGVSTMSCFKYSTIRIQSKWLHKPEFALFVSLYKSKWNLLHIVGIFNDAFKQLYNSWYIAKTPISLSPVSLTVHEVTFCLNRKANSSWRSS